MRRALPLLTLSLFPGCYLTHTRVDSEDADVRRSSDVRSDSIMRGDAPGEAGVDARTILEDTAGDAGRDAEAQDAAFVWPERPDPSTCRVEPAVAPFDAPILEYSWPGATEVLRPDSSQVCTTPVVIDLDARDGANAPVVAFVSYSTLGGDEQGLLRIWDPRTNTTITYPPGPLDPGPFEASTNLAAGDIDGDGQVEFVGIGTRTGTVAVNHDGTLLWESPYPLVAERGFDRTRTIGGAVALADLDGDGTVEVTAGTVILDGATGRFEAGARDTGHRAVNGQIGPISCVADLDLDGIQEVIVGPHVMRANGATMWTRPDLADGFCAVADVLDDPGPEVAIVANGYVRLLDERTGATLWEQLIEGGGAAPGGGPPTVGDFDGDGDAELAIAHGGAYGVYDPDCVARETPGCAAPGIRWTTPTEDGSSASTGSSLFDFNGDGRAEVVYNDQFYFMIYDGRTGNTLFRHPNSSRTRTENPVIADVDGDDRAEIVFSANNEAFFLRPRTTREGVFVWGDRLNRWVDARPIWNQHAYHVTNVEVSGRIASPEAPSWLGPNTYRMNAAESRDVLVSPDLWPESGDVACGARAQLRVRVENWGLLRTPAGIRITFRVDGPSGEVLAEGFTPVALEPSGGGTEVTVQVDVERVAGRSVWAVLDDGGDAAPSVRECREDNNAVRIAAAACR